MTSTPGRPRHPEGKRGHAEAPEHPRQGGATREARAWVTPTAHFGEAVDTETAPTPDADGAEATPPTDDQAPANADAQADTEADPEEGSPTVPSRTRNPLARDSDFVGRPGFRNPSNKRSKATGKRKGSGKKGKKGKKKRR